MSIREPYTLKQTAQRIKQEIATEDETASPWIPIREWLDDFYRIRAEEPEEIRKLLVEEPPATGEKEFDAYIEALAEHMAFHNNLEPPAWCTEVSQSLTPFWFPRYTVEERAMTDSPAAFRRRGIFVEKGALERSMSDYRGES